MAKVPELSSFLELLQEVRALSQHHFPVAVILCILMWFEMVARTAAVLLGAD
jgi:hypothetical protein